MGQPFATQRVVGGADFTDREPEVRRVLDAMRGRGRLVLYGERRMGKSSVIARARERFEAEGGLVVAVDAWTLDDLGELNRAILRSLPAHWLVGERAQRLLHALRSLVSLSVDEAGRPVLGLAGRAAEPDDAPATLGRILHGIDELAAETGRRVAVVIDEFQQLGEVHEGAGGVLRGIVQDTPHLGYVFAGSIVGLVMELLGPKGPFHAADRLEVGPIDADHLVRWMQHRFESHGIRAPEPVVRRIHERAGPVTEYVLRLAKVAFRRGRAGVALTDTLVDRAFDEVVADYAGSFELIWDGLSRGKRQVLRAVAAGEQQLTARDVMDRYEIASSSAAAYAITQLRHDGLLAPGKPFRVSDPFFAGWILGSAMTG
ncbi:MAG: AAA family ATPase [Longimicrobiales bacterium]|nr:AAA family ATPase [Longimicrobiales bacterium]